MSNIVTIRTHYKNLECRKYRRHVNLTWDALFAQFGGIFNLCLGGSIISLVEILFYFTFQLCFAPSLGDTRPTATKTVRRSQVADKRNLVEFVRRQPVY